MDLSYTVKRSAQRRRLTITVERDRKVVVHAPENMPDEAIEKVIQSKRQWIHEKFHHPQKYQDLPHPPGKELVSGEAALYLGRNYRIELVDDGSTEIQFSQKFTVPRVNARKRRDAFQGWYMAKAIEKILPRVKRQARELGVEFSSAKIVDNRYRWGSCTVKNNVNFNWRLIKAPMFVIDYVIVHELAHLIEGNHTPRFWNIVGSQTATATKAKEWLKKNGAILEEEI